MKSTYPQEKSRAIPLTNLSFIKELWKVVLHHDNARLSQSPTESSGTSMDWKWRGLEQYLRETYDITLYRQPSGYLLPESSVQYPTSDAIYISKSEAECASIAAQIHRLRHLQENESTMLGFINSSLLPWPLVNLSGKLRRIQEMPILRASTLEEPSANLGLRVSSSQRLQSWDLIPDRGSKWFFTPFLRGLELFFSLDRYL